MHIFEIIENKFKSNAAFKSSKTNILKKSANAIDKEDLLCYYNKAVEKRAGMAELADARDLKSRGTNIPYRFDPGFRHQFYIAEWSSLVARRAHNPKVMWFKSHLRNHSKSTCLASAFLVLFCLKRFIYLPYDIRLSTNYIFLHFIFEFKYNFCVTAAVSLNFFTILRCPCYNNIKIPYLDISVIILQKENIS